jgi:hypothetical protein
MSPYGEMFPYARCSRGASKMKTCQSSIKQGVCHTMALPFTFKSILRAKKNFETSNISPCKTIFFKNIL